MTIRIALCPPCGIPPKKMTTGANGFDCYANIEQEIHLMPGQRQAIPLGFRIEIPNNHVGFLLPRSGHAIKYGITLINSPGVIDTDYRGEVCALVVNTTTIRYIIAPQERIAQLVIVLAPNLTLTEISELSFSERGHNGFGSTN